MSYIESERITRLETMIERLKARVSVLEEKVEKLDGVDDVIDTQAPCSECGVVFVDQDAYAHHQCTGRQGR